MTKKTSKELPPIIAAFTIIDRNNTSIIKKSSKYSDESVYS